MNDSLNDSQREALLLDFIRRLQQHGSWCGETHIQKSTYFLQELLEVPLGLNYIFYKHGPFSFELNDRLTALRGNELLDLFSQPPYGPHLHISKTAPTYLELFPTTLDRFANQMDFIAKRLARKDVARLERLSTALYVLREMPEATSSQRSNEITRLKPHISLNDALQTLEEVEAMNQDRNSFQ